MIDLTASIDIKPHSIFSYWETDKEVASMSLTSDTPKDKIIKTIKTYADDVLNRQEDTECLIYEFSRGTIRLLYDKILGEEFKEFINKCLATESMIFYIQCF